MGSNPTLRAICLTCRCSTTGSAADLLAKFIFMIELNPKQKGNLTELKCISAFYELGYQCSIPYGENSRYDFIADIDG